MNIDISQIVTDKVAAMESDGVIKTEIEKHVEDSVKEAIRNVFSGYRIRQEIETVLAQQVPGIVRQIGLDGYNAFVAETVKKLVVTAVKEDAAKVLNERIEEILLMKRKEIRVSEILKGYRDYANLNDDEDEKHDLNENHDGYTCRLEKRINKYDSVFNYYTLYFDLNGDIEGPYPDDYDIVVRIRQYEDDPGVVTDVFISGNSINKQFAEQNPSNFEALLLNLYLNETDIIMDLNNYDEDDHYYETLGDY